MPELTREQIEDWREWFSIMFRETDGKQRAEANALCDMAASACPPPASADEIEQVARALCAEYGDNYDEQPERGAGLHSHDPGLPSRKDWRDMACAAIATYERLSAARAPDKAASEPEGGQR